MKDKVFMIFMFFKGQWGASSCEMDNLLRPPETRVNRRGRSSSSNELNVSDYELELSTSLRRQRSVSYPGEQKNKINNATRPWFSLELLYNITDIVLVLCAFIFIISSIAYLAIWFYGYWHSGVNSRKSIFFLDIYWNISMNISIKSH